MKKKTKDVLDIVLFVLGTIAIILLVYGIFKTFI